MDHHAIELRPFPARGQRGTAMVLALLVLFVLLVVIFQVFLTAEVELEQAAHRVSRARWEGLAEACALQARSSLLMDLEDAAEDEDSAAPGDAGGADDLFGGGGGGDEGSLDGALGGSSAEVAGSTDSALDEWAQSANLVPAMGEGLTLFVEVVDEDSKLNLLGLWTEDEEVAEEWREIVLFLLDEAFEGTSLDLSYADAQDVLDGLDDWVSGDRKSLDRRELPKLKLTDAQDAEQAEVETDIIDDDEGHYPLTLDELLLFEGLTRPHLDGFVEDGEHYPGLRESLTLWSHLELKAPPAEDEDDPFAGSPLGGADDEDPEEADETVIEGGQTANDGKVNCNTASELVLRALAPEDIPDTFIERVIEFRELMFEVRNDLIETQGPDWDQPDEDDPGAAEGEEDDLDEDDPAYYVFASPDEMFDKVEGQWDLSVFTDDEEKDRFMGRLSVTSEVFTIKIMIMEAGGGRRAHYRTTVWRLDEGERPRCVTLRPLHEYAESRRLEDFEKLEGFSAEADDDRFSRRGL